MTEAAIFSGSGAGQPLGILNSNAFVTVAKESSQTTASVVAANVVKMRARLLPRSRANAVFFVHLDVEPELQTMSIGNQPVYLPPGGLAGNPLGQLLGIPVVPIEHCEALGTPGDIVLADMSYYALGEKATSTMARSMHVRFLNDEETFRMTYRVDGFPMLQNPVTPNKGSNTLSTFVGVATRP
jgi:HK97 family phage major capsid protein